MGQAPYLPRGLSHIKDNNHSTTTVLNPKSPPIKGVITQEDEDLSTTIVLDKEGSSVHETIKNLSYHGTRTTMTHENRLPHYSKKQIKTANDKDNQPIGRQLKRKVLYIRMSKVLQRTSVHTKAKGILQQLFKPLAPTPSH